MQFVENACFVCNSLLFYFNIHNHTGTLFFVWTNTKTKL